MSATSPKPVRPHKAKIRLRWIQSTVVTIGLLVGVVAAYHLFQVQRAEDRLNRHYLNAVKHIGDRFDARFTALAHMVRHGRPERIPAISRPLPELDMNDTDLMDTGDEIQTQSPISSDELENIIEWSYSDMPRKECRPADQLNAKHTSSNTRSAVEQNPGRSPAKKDLAGPALLDTLLSHSQALTDALHAQYWAAKPGTKREWAADKLATLIESQASRLRIWIARNRGARIENLQNAKQCLEVSKIEDIQKHFRNAATHASQLEVIDSVEKLVGPDACKSLSVSSDRKNKNDEDITIRFDIDLTFINAIEFIRNVVDPVNYTDKSLRRRARAVHEKVRNIYLIIAAGLPRLACDAGIYNEHIIHATEFLASKERGIDLLPLYEDMGYRKDHVNKGGEVMECPEKLLIAKRSQVRNIYTRLSRYQDSPDTNKELKRRIQTYRLVLDPDFWPAFNAAETSVNECNDHSLTTPMQRACEDLKSIVNKFAYAARIEGGIANDSTPETLETCYRVFLLNISGSGATKGSRGDLCPLSLSGKAERINKNDREFLDLARSVIENNGQSLAGEDVRGPLTPEYKLTTSRGPSRKPLANEIDWLLGWVWEHNRNDSNRSEECAAAARESTNSTITVVERRPILPP